MNHRRRHSRLFLPPQHPSSGFAYLVPFLLALAILMKQDRISQAGTVNELELDEQTGEIELRVDVTKPSKLLPVQARKMCSAAESPRY